MNTLSSLLNAAKLPLAHKHNAACSDYESYRISAQHMAASTPTAALMVVNIEQCIILQHMVYRGYY
jgi:phage-related baseplate assembly protein